MRPRFSLSFLGKTARQASRRSSRGSRRGKGARGGVAFGNVARERAGTRRARKRRETPVGVLCAIWAAVALGLGGGFVATADGVSSRAMAATQDVMSIIRGRSPGARNATLLGKKGKGARLAIGKTPARSLVKPRTAAPAQVASAPPFSPIVSAPDLPFIYGPALLADALTFGPGLPGGFAGLPIGAPLLVGGGIGGGGGGGGGGGVTPPPPTGGGETPPPVVSPVPEPASWAMMILGFGAVGWTLRSRRRLGGAARAPLAAA